MKIVLRPPLRPQTIDDVNLERDRRLELGFLYADKRFQARSMDLINITGAASAASIAVASGAIEGNYRWDNAEVDFEWITADNSRIKLDAPGMVAVGMVAMQFVSVIMMKAREIKDRIEGGEIIEDVVDNSLWL